MGVISLKLQSEISQAKKDLLDYALLNDLYLYEDEVPDELRNVETISNVKAKVILYIKGLSNKSQNYSKIVSV